MSYYLQIVAIQTPFDIGVDKNVRIQYSCNYSIERYNSNTLLESDISRLIYTSTSPVIVPQSRITLGTKTILPPPTAAASTNPSLDGPFVRIISTGGYKSNISRSNVRAEYPSVQVIVASLDTQLAATAAWNIYRLLDGKRHTITV